MGFRVSSGHNSKKEIQKAYTHWPQSSQVLRLTGICTLCWIFPGSHLSFSSTGKKSRGAVRGPQSWLGYSSQLSSFAVPRQDGARHCRRVLLLTGSLQSHPSQLRSGKTTWPDPHLPLSASPHQDRRRRAKNGHQGGMLDVSQQKGRRVQAGAACIQWRTGGREGQSQALVPHLDLWPTCSCGDEDSGFRSAPFWQALLNSSALLCCACCKHFGDVL